MSDDLESDDLAEFLRARIAEVEDTARDMQDQERLGRPLLRLLGGGTGIRALVDPARVLAECEAKRYLLDLYASARARSNPLALLTELLIRFAAPYADHPDYRAKWRP